MSETNDIEKFLHEFLENDNDTTAKFLEFCKRIKVKSKSELKRYFLSADQENLVSSGFTACVKRFPRTRILKTLLGEYFHGVHNNLIGPAEVSLHAGSKRVPVIWLGVLLEPRSLDDEVVPTLEERQEIEKWAQTDLKSVGFPGVSFHEIQPPKYEWMIFSGPKREIERLHESLEDIDSPLREGRLFSLAETGPESCKILHSKPTSRDSQFEEGYKDTFGFGKVESDIEKNMRVTKSLLNYGVSTQDDLDEFLRLCFEDGDSVFVDHLSETLRLKRDQAFLEEYHKLSGTDVKMFNVPVRLKSLEEETNEKFTTGDFVACASLQPQINRLKSVMEIRELANIDANTGKVSPPVAGKRALSDDTDVKHDIADAKSEDIATSSLIRKKSKMFETETLFGVTFRLDSANRTLNTMKVISKTIHGCVRGGIIKESGKCVALKFSSKEKAIEYATTKPHMENVFDEIKIHSYLTENCDTPYIIGLHDFFLDNTEIVCVQDYASDGDLFDYCINRMSKEPQRREQLSKGLFLQLVEAVKTLHDNFIAHNDISLENILLHRMKNKQIFIKIIDFGMSKGGPDSEFSRGNWRVRIPSTNGKLGYRSPEVWNLEYDARANDIHCMGCCLFSMLTLQPAFANSNPNFDMRAKYIQDGRLAEVLMHSGVRYLSKEAVDLLQNMLLPEADRITMEGIIAHDWFT